MAAAGHAEAVCIPNSNVAVKSKQCSKGDLEIGASDVNVKREPVVPLISPPCGQQPLVWSQDHRLAVCTSGSLAVMELVCDVHSNKQDLTLHRTSLPVPNESPKIQVGPAGELAQSVEHFSTHPDPAVRQMFLADSVLNSSLGPQKGIKYAAWSPLGCDSSGRCLLACLTLDHRLTVHHSHRCLEWNMLIDLTEKYSARLAERGYAREDNGPPEADLQDFEELQRRYRMQTPMMMDWSSVYTLKEVQSDNTCVDTDMVILAVLMENGDMVLWKFSLPATADSDVAFYDLIDSGVTLPSTLAWWEYESCDRRMSGLIVGSKEGPLRIVPVSLTGVKGYFTLRHQVVLWRDCDGLAVQNMRCVAIDHPTLKSRCSLVVASRGCYVFWCLLVISPAGLNVHNSHVTGLHSLPIVSLAVSRRGTAVYTCSADGRLKKLTPEFTEKTLIFQQEDLMDPDCVLGRGRIQGLSVSCNDAYIAFASTQGVSGGNHQVNFVTLKAPDAAAAELLRSPTESLYRAADLLDLVRWQVLRNRFIPASLLDELEEKIRESDSPYLWRFKLFLVRVLYQSFRMPPTEHSWKPSLERRRVVDEDQEDGMDDRDVDGGVLAEEHGLPSKQEANLEERMAKVQTWIESVEGHIMRKNAKKVLGVVYLNTWIAENTSVPTCGLMDYLLGDTADRDSEVLIGHIRKKMNKQTFSERCTLCQEALPYSDHKRAVCKNGHMWLRCTLSFQACQSLTFRRCLLRDAVAKLPDPEDPLWIKKILQAPCALCDSPLI